MAVFEAADIDDLIEVFDEVGTTVTIVQQGTSHYDRATSRVVQDTPDQIYDIKVVVEDFNSPQFNGADIASGDKKFTALASAFRTPPTVGNIINLRSQPYTIPERGVKETYDGENVILYEIRGSF